MFFFVRYNPRLVEKGVIVGESGSLGRKNVGREGEEREERGGEEKAVIMRVLRWNAIQTIYPTLLRGAKVPATAVALLNKESY